MLKSAAIFMTGALTVAGLGAAAPDAAQAAHRAFRDTPLGRLVQGQIGRRMVLRSQLNVTAEQRDQIRAVFESHRGELADVAADLVDHKRQFRDEMTDPDATERDVRDAADRLGEVIGDAAMVGRALHREMQTIWTSEQRELIDEFQADKRGAVDTWLNEINVP